MIKDGTKEVGEYRVAAGQEVDFEKICPGCKEAIGQYIDKKSNEAKTWVGKNAARYINDVPSREDIQGWTSKLNYDSLVIHDTPEKLSVM